MLWIEKVAGRSAGLAQISGNRTRRTLTWVSFNKQKETIMTQEQLNRIIERENESLEDKAIQQATRLIAAISQRRQSIADFEREITQLQDELKKIEITKLDPVQILGN